MSENQNRQKLEIEDEDQRLSRIQPSRPHAVPQSDLIARVRAFLPELEASNAILEQQRQANPSSVDIESVEEDAQQYIEMNLGLGLFSERGKAASGSGEDESDSTSTDSSDEDSEMDDDSDEPEKENGQQENLPVRP
ncbi:hypothetical protein H0H92_012971 [Tricholoma furcatifolium]|nr:hypothetical protein H0H92_012971 [Tricholoma furcatifolium]